MLHCFWLNSRCNFLCACVHCNDWIFDTLLPKVDDYYIFFPRVSLTTRRRGWGNFKIEFIYFEVGAVKKLLNCLKKREGEVSEMGQGNVPIQTLNTHKFSYMINTNLDLCSYSESFLFHCYFLSLHSLSMQSPVLGLHQGLTPSLETTAWKKKNTVIKRTREWGRESEVWDIFMNLHTIVRVRRRERERKNVGRNVWKVSAIFTTFNFCNDPPTAMIVNNETWMRIKL